MHMKLLERENLARGTERQRRAFEAIESSALIESLKNHSPVLIGAIPLDVDVDTSPIEVVCSSENLEAFAQSLRERWAFADGFKLIHTVANGQPAIKARFRSLGFDVRILAQAMSVFQQPKVVTLLLAARLLTFAPSGARDEIRARIGRGEALEEAVANCFEIETEGEALEALLRLARQSDREILMVAHRFHFRS